MLDRCVVRVEEGLFVDQKWIDLVPGFYPDVGIIHHPGYNVAYWNLHCRHVDMDRMVEGDDDIRVNGEPLAFFHFSGLQPELPEVVSRHQDRFTLDDLGDLRRLFERYIALLQGRGIGGDARLALRLRVLRQPALRSRPWREPSTCRWVRAPANSVTRSRTGRRGQLLAVDERVRAPTHTTVRVAPLVLFMGNAT